VDVAPLLEPRVPRQPDPGELRHLFAPQARRASVAVALEADLLGGDLSAAGAEEVGQLGPAR
jgi:hypothetical protein